MADPDKPPHALTVQATILAQQVMALTKSVQALDFRANRSARATRLAIFGLVLDLVLSGLVIAALVGQSGNDAALQAEINRQVQVREAALCPLYRILTEARSDQGRETWPRGPVAYDEAFAQLDTAYTILDCGASP